MHPLVFVVMLLKTLVNQHRLVPAKVIAPENMNKIIMTGRGKTLSFQNTKWKDNTSRKKVKKKERNEERFFGIQ